MLQDAQTDANRALRTLTWIAVTVRIWDHSVTDAVVKIGRNFLCGCAMDQGRIKPIRKRDREMHSIISVSFRENPAAFIGYSGFLDKLRQKFSLVYGPKNLCLRVQRFQIGTSRA